MAGGGNSIGPISIALVADASQLAKGLDAAGKLTQMELSKATSDLGKADVGGVGKALSGSVAGSLTEALPDAFKDLDVQKFMPKAGNRLAQRFARAEFLGTDPGVQKRLALQLEEEQGARSFRLALGKERFGAIGEAGAHVSNAFEIMGHKLTALNPLLMLTGGGVAAMTGALFTAFKLTQTALHFAATADPWEAERLEQAHKDLVAVIGRPLIPALALATRGVQTLADFLNAVLPTASETGAIFDKLNPAFKEFNGILADTAAILRIAIREGMRQTGMVADWAKGAVGGPLANNNGQGFLRGFLFGPAAGIGGDLDKAPNAPDKSPMRFAEIGDITSHAILAALNTGPTIQEEIRNEQKEANGKLDFLAGLLQGILRVRMAR